MKKEFRDRTYQVLGVILLFTFTITAVSDFPFTGVIRTALGAVILGYVSGVRFKKPELNAEYPACGACWQPWKSGCRQNCSWARLPSSPSSALG